MKPGCHRNAQGLRIRKAASKEHMIEVLVTKPACPLICVCVCWLILVHAVELWVCLCCPLTVHYSAALMNSTFIKYCGCKHRFFSGQICMWTQQSALELIQKWLKDLLQFGNIILHFRSQMYRMIFLTVFPGLISNLIVAYYVHLGPSTVHQHIKKKMN